MCRRASSHDEREPPPVSVSIMCSTSARGIPSARARVMARCCRSRYFGGFGAGTVLSGVAVWLPTDSSHASDMDTEGSPSSSDRANVSGNDDGLTTQPTGFRIAVIQDEARYLVLSVTWFHLFQPNVSRADMLRAVRSEP